MLSLSKLRIQFSCNDAWKWEKDQNMPVKERTTHLMALGYPLASLLLVFMMTFALNFDVSFN